MYIPLDRDSKLPLPRQISGYLEELIRRGHLRRGGRLPATRSLATNLGVNKKTVEAAYEELEARKLVTIRPGRGVTVRSRIPETTTLDLPFRPGRSRDPFPSAAWVYAADEPSREIDLAGIGPRLPNVSTRALRAYHESALGPGGGPLFSPAPPLGESSLRAAACAHFAHSGILRSPEEVAVFESRPEAVRAIIRAFVPRGEVVLAEGLLDPELVLPVREERRKLVRLPASGAGSLEKAFARKRVRLLLMATGESRLTTAPPPLTRRRTLVDLARTHGIPVLEDVTGTERRREAGTPAPAAVLDASGRVIPLCDLSDEAGGHLTGGAVAGTVKLLDRIRQEHEAMDRPLERLRQRALARALEDPGRARSLQATRERRKLRTASIRRTIRRRLPEFGEPAFTAGADAVTIPLPAGVTGVALARAAAERGVVVRTAADCGVTSAEEDFVLLDLTRREEGDVLEGIRHLGEAFDRLEG